MRESGEGAVKALGIIMTVLYLGLFIILPFAGVLVGALSRGFGEFWANVNLGPARQARALSFALTLGVVPPVLVFGLASAWLLARFRFPGRRIILFLLDLPFALSPVIVGLLFILLYGANTPLGAVLESWGIRIIFAWPGLFMVTLFISFPFVVREVLPVLEELGTENEEAALLLGAGGWQIFFRVTLPNLKYALLYGISLSSARALGEYGAVSVVSGLLRGRTVTLPIQVQIYYNEYMTGAALGSASLFLLFSLVTLVSKKLIDGSANRKNRSSYDH